MAEIVLVHAGSAPPPAHFADMVRITQRVASKSSITVLANACNASAVQALGSFFQYVPIESIPASPEHRQFAQSSALNKEFRDGFWYHTTSRFFVISDYMQAQQLEDVVHFENDVVPYFDPTDMLVALRKHADFAVPLDRSRAIASVVWIAHSKAASALSKHLVEHPAINDMAALNDFCQRNASFAKPLPTLPPAYAKAKKLDEMRYCQGYDTFGGIFDAAAIGQYVGGVDRMNNPHDSRFFLNESSDLDLRGFDFSWRLRGGTRSPLLRYQGSPIPVLCLHAHCKDLAGVSPFNHGAPEKPEDIITGERLQACADLTLSTPAITQFHGALNIQTVHVTEIPQNEQGQLLVPSAELVAACQQANTIFVYTHLLTYFRLYIAPRLHKPFVLLSHNSDHAVTVSELDLLNHPQLVHWWAQNCELAHTRLSALPIGLANKQWGAEKLDQLFQAAQNLDKDKLLYANVGLTHPSRTQARNAAAQVPGATLEGGLDYPAYLASMARHQFCICPRGNGIDTHRIWEAWYLHCIPIIVKADWTSAYSGLPLLVLETWDQLPTTDLAQHYIRISSTAQRFDSLTLSHWQQRIQSTATST